MKIRRFQDLLKLAVLTSTAQIAMLPAHAQSIGPQPGNMELLKPTGVFISPTAIPGSNQQFLNPRLPPYPNFVASEAVKLALSPDGNTLAIITSGYNLLRFTSGATDVANSTQYIFVYDVSGANKANPEVGSGDQADQCVYGSGLERQRDPVRLRRSRRQGLCLRARRAAPSALFAAAGAIALGHKQGTPTAGGLAVSANGKTLLVTIPVTPRSV